MPKIVDEPVQAYRERLLCDCGHEMEFTGGTLLSSPPQYEHHCKGCGARATMKQKFPRIEFR